MGTMSEGPLMKGLLKDLWAGQGNQRGQSRPQGPARVGSIYPLGQDRGGSVFLEWERSASGQGTERVGKFQRLYIWGHKWRMTRMQTPDSDVKIRAVS